MNYTEDIQPLSEFKQNASKYLKHVRETGRPMVLTVNGKPTAILQDVDAYQELTQGRVYRETVRILRERLEYVRSGGELRPAEEVFQRISEKTGITF